MSDITRKPASTYSDGELARVTESGLLRGGLVALEETLRRQDETIERMRAFSDRLAAELSSALQAVRSQADYIEELCAAGWDVLPVLEGGWKGAFPIPEGHPVAELRRILEENR
ncbi:hypothetical protein SE17_23335 [Kouleothrix aurantiaca]|uniref:Uncharacterized protein n=1 Tax=Kouleothrix aurantiaca TaxID=186479 RepID=A0A0P9F3G7_9CHLR|nr:hypothetical protein SE17_23335 [Kouleothrix aurantiaca]